MYHYTYIITNNNETTDNGKYYIGVRTSLNMPHEDTEYFGSSEYLKEDINEKGKNSFTKEILGIFNNREEAMQHEIELHNFFDVEKNDLFYNKHN